MDFIVIKFEQAKRAVTTERNDLIMANGSYKAIRPYYYGLGKEYGLDKNAIDNLVKYDEKSGQVSFGGKNLGRPVVEANGVSYWDENKLKNEWNNYITNNGLNKIGAKFSVFSLYLCGIIFPFFADN